MLLCYYRCWNGAYGQVIVVKRPQHVFWSKRFSLIVSRVIQCDTNSQRSAAINAILADRTALLTTAIPDSGCRSSYSKNV